ncbi:magnesium transporter [Lachnospiraceae bacterium OM04-12BH]|nr:magnesium transporter [Lachnospiraceae bacterium OM04-12BH]
MTKYVEELIEIIRAGLSREELVDWLFDYHDNDIADALELLTPEERKRLYSALGAERVAEIFAYLDDGDVYLKELSLKQQAKVISKMDSDDAVDILEEVDDDTKCKILGMLDKEASEDVQLLLSYDEDEIGSYMTTNFILIHNDLTVREAMRELVKQAGENDNISTIYVVDWAEQYYGAIELQDLIIAREHTELEDLINRSYPYVMDHEKISECIEKIKDYAEDSIPVLLEDRSIGGIITTQDIVEIVDDEMGGDYAKLAGLIAEEDLNETTRESIRKRLPWLVILTVMVLLFLGAYIHLFKGFSLGYSMMISACVGVSLVGAMVVSSLVGTLTPIFFKKVGVDPAVASGPLITTINDLVAIVVYYGLVAVVLIDIIHLV